MKYIEALNYGQELLKENGVTEYEADAFILFEYVFDITRQKYLLKKTDEVPEADYDKYVQVINKRLTGLPVQYITGVQNFMGYDFSVNENVLIPRYDTEALVAWILEDNKSDINKKVLDICTGSGCILLSILLERPEYIGTGLDISDRALKVAITNKNNLGVKNASFIQSDMFENVQDKYDIIVSNPPYIQTSVIETLDVEVKNKEPRLALDGGEDGLDFYRIIAENSKDYLNENGLLYLEIGYDQGQSVKQLLLDNGFINVEVKKDFAGLDRCVKACVNK